jgi:hypothetical protein
MSIRSFKLNLRLFVILLVVFIVGCVGYYLDRIDQEKRDFAKAETSIDSVAQAIQAKIGKADEIKKQKSCARTSQEYGEGQLSCDVSLYLLYHNKNAEQSSSMMKDISELQQSPVRIGSASATNDNDFNADPDKRGDQIYFQDFGSKDCGLSYRYPAQEFTVFKATNFTNLQIELSCGKTTIRQLYPMRN